MRLNYSDQFLGQSKKLPAEAKKKLAHLLDLLALNPYHPLLHTKKLSGHPGNAYSFRITRDWRVIFMFENRDTIKLLKVGHRKDIYR